MWPRNDGERQWSTMSVNKRLKRDPSTARQINSIGR